jgi:UDP-2,4-diacetamido-2,4,6-trideoxy-beta-L-altropyranose hydrolase
MNIVFRVDGNSNVGTGHVMRCQTLARQLQSKANIFFILSDESKNIINLITDKKIELIFLEKHPYMHEHGNIFSFEHMKFDVNQTKEQILKIGTIDWLIIDHYAIEKKWEDQLRPIVKNLMVIDDLANREHNCDILLDQNYVINNDRRYDLLVPMDCLKLLGPSFALLRDEFILQDKKRDVAKVSNILISFGGSDPHNFTGKLLEVLLNYKDITVNVVIGGANLYQDEIKDLCALHPNFIYHFKINYMAKLMSESDIFIGAGGATTLELMAMGLPALLISTADNQTKICEILASENIIKYLGTSDQYSKENFIEIFNEIINDASWRKIVKAKCADLIDCNGAHKVSDYILATSGNTKN